MALRRLIVLLLALLLLVAGCSKPLESKEANSYDLAVSDSVSLHREEVIVELDVEDRVISSRGQTDVFVHLDAPGGVPPIAGWLQIQLAKDLKIGSLVSGVWSCSAPSRSATSILVLCRVSDDEIGNAIAEGLRFKVTSGERLGLHGIAVEVGLGEPPATATDWVALRDGINAARAMINVTRSTLVKREIRRTSHVKKSNAAFRQSSFTGFVEVGTPPSARVASLTAAGQTAHSQTSLTAFCALYSAIGVTGSPVVVGPVTFSNLSSSTTSGGGCDSNSTITLRAASIGFGSVTFSDVTGSINSATITINSRVVDGNVALTISGPFPAAAGEYSAQATFGIGGQDLTVEGSLDYSTANQVTIELGASSGSLNWAPLPGFSLATGGVNGSLTRKWSGQNITDMFNLEMEFSGSWNPIGDVSVSSVSVDVNDSNGELDVSLDAKFGGRIAIGELNLTMSGAVDGSIDNSGATTLEIDLGDVGIDGIVAISPAKARFSYDPTVGGSKGTTVLVTGNAAFSPALQGFFAGSNVTATIDFASDFFLLSASMNTAPTSPGFSFQSLQFVYASSTSSDVIQFQPDYPQASGVLIPLQNKSPLMVATTQGLPSSFAATLRSLDIDIIDPAAIGVIAMELTGSEAEFSIYYAAPSQPYLLGNASSSTSLRFDDVFISLEVGTTESFSIGGNVTLQVSGSTLQLTSDLVISVSETGGNVEGQLTLIDTSGWQNAFGVEQLTVYSLVIQAGMADLAPSFGVEATASLPSTITSPLGIVPGSVITLGLNLSATSACAIFSISPAKDGSQTNVINLDNGGLTATFAQIILSPEGCTLGQTQYQPGFALTFTGAIRGVNVGFNCTFQLEPTFSLTGSGYIGSFPLGSLQLNKTTVNLSISSSGLSLILSGSLAAGSSLVASGNVQLSSEGGFNFDGEGTLYVNGSGASVKVHATDCKDINCLTLDAPSFSVSGEVKIQGFDFSANVNVSSNGAFQATLTIQNQSHEFTFSNDNPKVSGKGTLVYKLSVVVSDSSSDSLSFSATASLSSCSITIVFPIDCKDSSISISEIIKTGSVAVTLKIKKDETTFTTGFSV